MSTDLTESPSHHLALAARARSVAALHRTEAVLDDATRMRNIDTVVALARAADVSRAWLYTQPALLQRLRDRPTPSPTPRPATAATDASLLRRLELAHLRNRELEDEIVRLRDELASAYGQLRESRS